MLRTRGVGPVEGRPYHSRMSQRSTAMPEFVVGQRYISDAEPELGLGLVTEVEFRTLSLSFAATGETRRYALANSPLTRISFEAGDTLRLADGDEAEVLAVEARRGLLVYQVRLQATGEVRVASEVDLSPLLSLSQPLKRLLAGRLESSGWFQLRRAALAALARIEGSHLLGLGSARTELLPHQLYIAHEVAKRPAPRVLLCDEVGLGKTIEACLILQQQLWSGLASRVLVLLPTSLQHQWLVELLRRFNLRFTLLDAERCDAITEHTSVNPFETAQLVICSSEFLCSAPVWRANALAATWDLVIVDEAHHLAVAGGLPGAEALVSELAQAAPGLLLLTATPDQAGLATHFNLLRLLDPRRFHDYQAFIEEQQHYRGLAERLEALPDGADTELDALLDRHGTGRIVFRNTRQNIRGFPPRLLHRHALPLPALYHGKEHLLQPELSGVMAEQWLREDPRVACLLTLIREHAIRKLLVICHSQQSTGVLEEYLRVQQGIRTAVFHEGLTLLERDRAAAYFAEAEGGAEVLLCSEIGSEGRNFQFCQHLFMFDLPLNPDLLEQRIGRLDRIGQSLPVNLHVPYFVNSASERLLELYADRLGITRQPNPVAAQVCSEFRTTIDQLLLQPDAPTTAVLGDAIAARNTALLQQHAEGRDRLLELNSCRPKAAADLVTAVQQQELEGSPRQFLRQVFASYGLDNEENSNGTWSVTPGADMMLESFPCVPDEGLTFTVNRALALRRDDLPFVTWLHPLVLQSLDQVLQDHSGKATVGVLKDARLPAGTLVLESLFRVTVAGPTRLQVKRWFPTCTLRAVVDSQRRSLGKALSPEQLDRQTETLSKAQLRVLLGEHRGTIDLLAKLGQKVAEKQLPLLIDERTSTMQRQLDLELERLQALSQVNPQVSETELQYLVEQRTALTRCFADARLQLEAVRLLVVL